MQKIWLSLLLLALSLPLLAEETDLIRFEQVVQHLSETSKSQPSSQSLIAAAQAVLEISDGVSNKASSVQRALLESNDRGKLQIQVIDALLTSLHDPWAKLYQPEEMSELKKRLNGDSQGALGLTVIKTDDPPAYAVAYIAPGGPADGKLVAGDQIVGANGVSAAEENFSEHLQPRSGEKVRFQVLSSKGVERQVSLTPKKFNSKTAYTIDKDLGLIRISSFGTDTAKELKEALAEIGDKPVIIDLRLNGGGYVTAAVESADLFIKEGSHVMTTVAPKGNKTHFTERPVQFEQPVCLLVNSKTASAAEIFAGALRTHARALVVGEQTYGKGSVQRLVELSGNWGLKYTTSLYQTADGVFIDKVGISPDIEVAMKLSQTAAPGDRQLQAALDWRSHKTVAHR